VILRDALNRVSTNPQDGFFSLVLKSTSKFSRLFASSFGVWTPAKLVCGVLVLAMHWALLSFVAQKLKDPPTTAHTSEAAFLIRWILPTSGAVQMNSVGMVSSVFSLPKKNPVSNLSPHATKLSISANNSPFNQKGIVSEADPGWNPVNYRTSQEVDTRAAPVMDWMINRESVPRKAFATVIVTVWVSAAGVIDHFQIESQEPAGDWASAALNSLPTTLMEPATLGGEPVASTMTVEISLDNTNNEPGTN
jgi:hypothetical protein